MAKHERQVDHHMADAGGDQRLRQADPVEEDQQPHADDEIADGERQRDEAAQQGRCRQDETARSPRRERKPSNVAIAEVMSRDEQRIDQSPRSAVASLSTAPYQRKRWPVEGRNGKQRALEREQHQHRDRQEDEAIEGERRRRRMIRPIMPARSSASARRRDRRRSPRP